jgi:hypothetical protein
VRNVLAVLIDRPVFSLASFAHSVFQKLMLRATFSCVLVSTAEGCVSVVQRAAGSLIKPVKDKGIPTIEEGRQAFEGDLRATSGLGIADGITNHTSKWLQVFHCTSFPSQCMNVNF